MTGYRRFAFNSLLRGDKPIRAKLRPLSDTLESSKPSNSHSIDLENTSSIDESSSSFASSAHGLIKDGTTTIFHAGACAMLIKMFLVF
jgi:hypothetical protein